MCPKLLLMRVLHLQGDQVAICRRFFSLQGRKMLENLQECKSVVLTLELMLIIHS